MANTTALNRSAFKTALRRVANDPNFGRELNEKPGTALRSIGLEFPDAVASQLDRQPLSRTIEQAFGPPHEGPRLEAEVIVHVGVSVAVDVAIGVLAAAEVGERPGTTLDEAIEKAAELSKIEVK